MKRSPAIEGGLEVRKDHTGWTVVHAASGLYAASSLRQRRFAEQARAEFLATGVDFTASKHEVYKARDKWTVVYLRWHNRASATDIDPETFEYYPSHSRYGQLIPSAELASEMREARIHPGDARKYVQALETPWRPAVNGAGKRPWFLTRGWGTECDLLPVGKRYYFGPSGQLVRYASMENAQRAADKLNKGTE